MRNCRTILAAAAILLAAASCSDKTQIKGTLTDAPEAEIIVKQLAGSSLDILDTLKTDAAGKYSYSMKIEEGQPEFVYLFKGDTKLASLLLQKGDKVTVVSDTLGKYTVEGSEECTKLQEVENDYAEFMGKMAAAAATGDQQTLSRTYVDYYRSRVKYVMENAKSLTSIPVLYQKINDGFPVFSQNSDAIQFKSVHDSLMKVYPKSEYVAALSDEADRRFNVMNINLRIQDASEAPFPELELPSYDGTKVKLSDVKGKVVMVYFWMAENTAQKLFNQEQLLPIYADYHDKGFEVYSVSLDTDKGTWASAVKDQKLPWINVCDGLGAASPAASTYNITNGLPVAYLIINGELSKDEISSAADLRRILSANL